jgi:hypothetical protein
MTKKDGQFLVILFLLSCLWISCETERDPCLQPKTVPLRLIAKRPITDSTTVDTLLPHPIWITVDSLDTLKYGAKTSNFSLLLSSITDSCRYALQPDTALVSFDTITFYYDRRLQFISNACGFTYFYTLKTLKSTTHNIDSVKINNADVNQNASTPEHVQIYF